MSDEKINFAKAQPNMMSDGRQEALVKFMADTLQGVLDHTDKGWEVIDVPAKGAIMILYQDGHLWPVIISRGNATKDEDKIEVADVLRQIANQLAPLSFTNGDAALPLIDLEHDDHGGSPHDD